MTPILQRLVLEKYRGIVGLELNDLSPVNLIVGVNNAGKSSILEAASLLLRAPDPGQWVQIARQRDLDMPFEDALWSIFPGGSAINLENGPQQTDSLRLSGRLHGHDDRSIQARCLVSERWGTEGETEISQRIELKVDRDQPVAWEFKQNAPIQWSRGRVFRAFTVTSAAHRSTRAFIDHLSHVVDEGKKDFAIEMARVFDADIEGLDVVEISSRRSIRVTHRTRGVVDLSSFGDGLRRAVLLSLVLARAANGVLLIDEIEAGIHHSALDAVLHKLVEAAASAQVQLLATTHSLEAVDAVLAVIEARAVPDALSTFWIKRDGNAQEARRYDLARLSVLREGGLDIR